MIVVLDACVLFPFTLRDTLLRAAAAGLYQVRWSSEILDEMERNLVSTATLSADKAARLRAVMDREFPEAHVTGYEPLVPRMRNHEKDRHVAAAAAKAGAHIIATSNVKDFKRLRKGIEAMSPDKFLCSMFHGDPDAVVEILRQQAGDLNKPPMSFEALLERLGRSVPKLVALVQRHVVPR
ncbi:MAG: PIN domain-containing protein [Deltaproteobacteria bacterium]|nr:PIN domain-containing protein [Deltaproteobacteria bacterium]